LGDLCALFGLLSAVVNSSNDETNIRRTLQAVRRDAGTAEHVATAPMAFSRSADWLRTSRSSSAAPPLAVLAWSMRRVKSSTTRASSGLSIGATPSAATMSRLTGGAQTSSSARRCLAGRDVQAVSDVGRRDR